MRAGSDSMFYLRRGMGISLLLHLDDVVFPKDDWASFCINKCSWVDDAAIPKVYLTNEFSRVANDYSWSFAAASSCTIDCSSGTS